MISSATTLAPKRKLRTPGWYSEICPINQRVFVRERTMRSELQISLVWLRNSSWPERIAEISLDRRSIGSVGSDPTKLSGSRWRDTVGRLACLATHSHTRARIQILPCIGRLTSSCLWPSCSWLPTSTFSPAVRYSICVSECVFLSCFSFFFSSHTVLLGVFLVHTACSVVPRPPPGCLRGDTRNCRPTTLRLYRIPFRSLALASHSSAARPTSSAKRANGYGEDDFAFCVWCIVLLLSTSPE
jgi:hypothetical protein